MQTFSKLQYFKPYKIFNLMRYINIRTITPDELRQLQLNDLVSICKSLDNANGDWRDVTADEYEYILHTAIESVAEFQNDL